MMQLLKVSRYYSINYTNVLYAMNKNMRALLNAKKPQNK